MVCVLPWEGAVMTSSTDSVQMPAVFPQCPFLFQDPIQEAPLLRLLLLSQFPELPLHGALALDDLDRTEEGQLSILWW
jgi:hypothetical protein